MKTYSYSPEQRLRQAVQDVLEKPIYKPTILLEDIDEDAVVCIRALYTPTQMDDIVTDLQKAFREYGKVD